MKTVIITLFLAGLCMSAGAQDKATADLFKQQQATTTSNLPIYVGPGNITKDLDKVKKGTKTTLKINFNGSTGNTTQDPISRSGNLIQRPSYKITGFQLPENTAITNGSLDQQGQFTALYQAASQAGPINEVIEVLSTTGTFYVYVTGQVVE